MIDKDGNIKTQNEKIKRYYQIFKDNTAQIVMAISIVATLFSVVYGCYQNVYTSGYYDYFGIDTELALAYDDIGLYHIIQKMVLMVTYCVYALFSVMIFEKKHIFGNIITLIVVPVVINCWTAYSKNVNLEINIYFFLKILFQWIMIFAIGRYIMIFVRNDIKSKPKKKEKGKKKKRKQLTDKEYTCLGWLIICLFIVFVFYNTYISRKEEAAVKREFGIVRIEQQEYAVIDKNESKLILQKCERENKNLKIYVSTYLCMTNNVNIEFETFEKVELI